MFRLWTPSQIWCQDNYQVIKLMRHSKLASQTRIQLRTRFQKMVVMKAMSQLCKRLLLRKVVRLLLLSQLNLL